jgi:uroporphyrinogen-III synthase
LQSSAVVFTSMNAVEAVADNLRGRMPDWKIYCIGTTTGSLVKKHFGPGAIGGTANSALELAALIVNEGEDDEVIFFCGNQRREELPEILKNNHIDVNEIVVYETIPVPHNLRKQYHGILFFSPSAVESFFSNNKAEVSTVLFAIGNTTANAIKKFSNNKVLITEEPGKENLVRNMMEYFGDV